MASPAALSRFPDAPGRSRLILTGPKNLAALQSPLNNVLGLTLDPQPHWTLDDLKHELDALSQILDNVPTLPHDHSSSSNASCVSWRQLSAVADFGRETRPFRICAFDDDDTDSDEEAQQAQDFTESHDFDGHQATKGMSSSAAGVPGARASLEGACLLPRTEIVEGSLFEMERERLLRVQEEVRQRHLILETAIEEETNRSAAIFEQVEKDKELKHEIARRTDKQYHRSIAEARDIHLSALQREHEQRSQVEERKIKKEAAAEEARRREISAREERERQEKMKAEAEAKRKADALLANKIAAEAERKRHAEAAAAAALQRSEAERIAKQQMEQNIKKPVENEGEKVSLASSSEEKIAAGPKAIVSESAAKLELGRTQKMRALLEVSYNLQSNPDLKKDLKSYERRIIKILQQVSATQEQVRIKSMELMRLLADPSMHPAFFMTTFASKLMSQCEIQISKRTSFAFALAQVVVNVASQNPEIVDVVLAKLHEVCIFTVPKYYVFKRNQFENDKSYYKALGYKEEDGKLETTDDYVARMNVYMNFYAAIIQAEVPGGVNPHGLKDGWAWCAHLLNRAPADRLTASALECFLKVAGFRLYHAYKKAFMKLLQTIASDFIESLKVQNDPDSRAVVNRLETYLQTQEFLQEPEGHRMPTIDTSGDLKP